MQAHLARQVARGRHAAVSAHCCLSPSMCMALLTRAAIDELSRPRPLQSCDHSTQPDPSVLVLFGPYSEFLMLARTYQTTSLHS